MPSALQREIGRHNPLCAASRLGIQAMASLRKVSRAEFSHQYFLVAAATLQVCVGSDDDSREGALELRKIRAAEHVDFLWSPNFRRAADYKNLLV